ncbi:DUF6973 domain-containing protein [Altibacter lentus]|uniref:DUF6973 domain-containing protein n=1 Tax=Altibacter lentus TaxID=1223410 RepID=UPI00054EBEC7
MTIWARIQKLSIGQLWKLSLLFLSRPRLIGPTLRATRKTMDICDRLYGKAHHKSTKGNAFRHALWNYLICHEHYKIAENKQKAVVWAKKVTTLYEKVTQNAIIDEKMDLHNNEIGRREFHSNILLKQEEIVSFFSEKTQKAVKITPESRNYPKNELVYIVEL